MSQISTAGVNPSVIASFAEHGFALLPSFLDEDELRPAQRDLPTVFPTGDEFHSGVNPERNARFTLHQWSGIDPFPYASVEWSLLGLHPRIVELAEALLGTTEIRVSEAHNWAKYGGGVDYEQMLHRDYGNHSIVAPAADSCLGDVEMFIYIHDVPIDAGPTYVVSTQHSAGVPIAPTHVSRDDYPDVYRHEVAADGPAGTVLAYHSGTLHRGSTMTNPLGARFMLKVSFRRVSDVWFDRMGLSERLWHPGWHRFVEAATPRQLELIGFPPRGHRYWTEHTWAATSQRYSSADLSAFRPS